MELQHLFLTLGRNSEGVSFAWGKLKSDTSGSKVTGCNISLLLFILQVALTAYDAPQTPSIEGLCLVEFFTMYSVMVSHASSLPVATPGISSSGQSVKGRAWMPPYGRPRLDMAAASTSRRAHGGGSLAACASGWCRRPQQGLQRRQHAGNQLLSRACGWGGGWGIKRGGPLKSRSMPLRMGVMCCSAEVIEKALMEVVSMYLENDMVLAVGGGLLSEGLLASMGARVAEGRLTGVKVIPMSVACKTLASMAGLETLSIGAATKVDLAVADAFTLADGTLDAIRGLEPEDCLEKETRLLPRVDKLMLLVMPDAVRQQLGGVVPVVIGKENWEEVAEALDDIFVGQASIWRRPAEGKVTNPSGGNNPYVTEEGNYILDILFEEDIKDPEAVAAAIESVPGVKCHGLLLNKATSAIIVGGVHGWVPRYPIMRNVIIPGT
eukprot:jgi/Mesvir1/18243/Mv09521-RA.1